MFFFLLLFVIVLFFLLFIVGDLFIHSTGSALQQKQIYQYHASYGWLFCSGNNEGERWTHIHCFFFCVCAEVSIERDQQNRGTKEPLIIYFSLLLFLWGKMVANKENIFLL